MTAVLSRLLAGGLAQVPGTQVEQAIRWLRAPPAWLVVLVIIPLVVLFTYAFYRRESPSGSPLWRWVLGSLRTLCLLFVLAMLGEPVRRKTTYETRDSTILVMVDDSLSMDMADRFSDRELARRLAESLGMTLEEAEATTRYDLVRRLLHDERWRFLERLREKGKVVLVSFAGGVVEHAELERLGKEPPPSGTPGEAARPEPASTPPAAGVLPPYEKIRGDGRVQETRIGEGLRDAVASILGSGFGEREERVSGVILLSDGQQNAGSVSAAVVARRLGDRGTPVFTIGVGNPDEPKDIRLTHLDVNEVVLVDDVVGFHAGLVAEGFEGERVRVDLKMDSAIVATEYAVLEGGGRQQLVRLDYRPRKPGEFTATVEVERLGGEVFEDNNSLSKTIRVLDEKIKVLYVESFPRWEYRYLKNTLIRDATMEAQIYLLNADPSFIQESSPGVPPLRELPDTRSALFGYHVIILGDVDPKEQLGSGRAELLKEFVAEGGGMVFIAGPHGNPSRFLHTELYPVLPVEVREVREFDRPDFAPATIPFRVRLTPVGQEHPIMRLVNDRQRNIDLWEREEAALTEHLADFYWFAQVERAKAGAVVLGRHAERLHPIHRQGLVIFAVMSYGKGRSFFSAVDNTWRWRRGVDTLYFARFWGQVVRYVATGRLLGKTPRFQVTTDKTVYNIGETVRVDARVLDANMKPLTDPTVTLYHQVQGREGEPPERIELALNTVKGQGFYEGALSTGLRGRHDIWLGTEEERLAFRTFAVEVPALEARDPRLDRAFLQAIATASGGKYADLADAAGVLDDVRGASRSREGLVEDDALWDEWWVLVAFTLLISVEWILRKLVRLV